MLMDEVKKEAAKWGMRVYYRNRQGKEYVEVFYDKVAPWQISEWEKEDYRVAVYGWYTTMKMGRWLVTKFWPNARMTSGGASISSTYRINQ